MKLCIGMAIYFVIASALYYPDIEALRALATVAHVYIAAAAVIYNQKEQP